MTQSYGIGSKDFQGYILLWALGEAGLGGIIHALGLPITGLLVGGWAAVCLSMMALRGAKGADFLKALLQVLIIKAIASPHSPLPAYLAVGFQGLLASLLFGQIRWGLAVPVFTILSMVESAVQKVISITLIFGMPFWDGVQALIKKVGNITGMEATGQEGLWLAGGWIVLHGLFGLLVSIWIRALPGKMKRLPNDRLTAETLPVKSRKRNIALGIIVLLAPMLVLLFLPFERAVYGLIRAWAALLLWFTLGSWLMSKLTGWLKNRKEGQSSEVQSLLGQLPHVRGMAVSAWKVSGNYRKGIGRWGLAAMLLLREGA
jgi:hypothetical protein